MSGRIFIGPEPAYGPHPGYRGPMELDGAWIHLGTDAEWLNIQSYAQVPEGDLPRSDWELLERSMSIPVATVQMIEWDKS